MRYLITGATGLVGKEIVKLCHANGIAVNYLTTSRNKIVSQENYQGFYWNPDTREIDVACFKGVSVIINLAGTPISKRWTPLNKKKILASRINSVKTLFKALKSGKYPAIDFFVSASAVGVYPNSLENYFEEQEEKIDASFLGDVVQQWETEVDTLKTLEISVAKVRIGLVLASEGGALPQMAKPVMLCVGSAFGSGEQWQSWVHINDIARVFLFVAENKLTGVFNAVAPNPVSQNKLIKEISIVLKKPLVLPNIPKFFIKIIWGETSYLILASQRVSCKKIEKEGFVFKYSNVASALQAIYH